MIVVNNVSKVFDLRDGGRVKALELVSLTVERNEFLCIVGPSGCGKSTLLNIMMGLEMPTDGEITIGGVPSNPKSMRFGYMLQKDSLLPWRTVLGNIEVGMEIRGISRRVRKRMAQELIMQMNLMGFERSYPFELSGGMGKRVSFARSLAYDPEIIFMDEPFGALDVQTRDSLETDILKRWEQDRRTIVFVTHDISEAVALSDRVLLMTARPGRIKSEHIIDLPRPRDTSELRFKPSFIEIVKSLWQELSTEVKMAREHQNEG